MEHIKPLIWSYLRCFDHDKPDYGIDEYLQKVGRPVEGFCALVAHPDFIHQYPGMAEEHRFPPYLCGCRKDPRRLSPAEYDRMSWTNYQIRGLVEELHRRGLKIHISVWGSYFLDLFHQEWLGQHKELLLETTTRTQELNALKRLKDGTYYEDFLIAQLEKVLSDYGLDGIHLSDRFSPLSEPLADGDYSADMVTQFADYAKISLPAEISAHLEEDSTQQKTARQQFIWQNHRAAWIRFHGWRWTKFYQKLCAALHAMGKEVSTLGMYVSDTLRSRYSMGFDIGAVAKAGVDFFTPNVLPTSCQMNARYDDMFGENLFHRYMTFLPAVKANAPDTQLLLMLGIRDEEEEWDVIRHAPNQFERDVFTAHSYQILRPTGPVRCIDHPFVTMGDSIGPAEWATLHRYLDAIASAKIRRVVSPVLFWSDTASQAMLEAHIATRRPSLEQMQSHLQAKGAFCGGVVRSEELACCDSPLFVPAFDLLSEEEKTALLREKRPLLAFAPADYDSSALGATVSFRDKFSAWPQQVFLLHAPAPADLAPYEELLAQNDGRPDLPPETDLHDETLNVMFEMHFQKVSEGFRAAAAKLFRHLDAQTNPITSTSPLLVLEEEDGAYRVLVYSGSEVHYDRSLVTARTRIRSVETLSDFPYRPVQFIDQVTTPGETRDMARRMDAASGRTFQLKIRPAGLSVFRIRLED